MAGALRWFDVSNMGMIRHMPQVAVAWFTVGVLALAALATNSLASTVGSAGALVVQMLAGFVSVLALASAFKWFKGGSVTWARTTAVTLAALLGVNIGLVVWLGPSERVLGMAMPGLMIPLAVLVGCRLWLRRRRLGRPSMSRRVVVHEGQTR